MKKPLFSIFWMERPARRRKYNERTQHIAIILDGNGRWAKKKNMPRNYGHARGARTWRGSVRLLQDGDQIFDGLCILHGELEPPVGRGQCVDEASAKLYEDLSEDRREKPDAGSGHRR